MAVYKVEKSNILMLLQTYWDLELQVSSKSFEIFNIHIWLTPFLENQVSWYFWRPSFTDIKIEVKILERCLVEHLTAGTYKFVNGRQNTGMCYWNDSINTMRDPTFAPLE